MPRAQHRRALLTPSSSAAQLRASSKSEKMPTSLAGFKSHALYCLRSQLLRDQALRPGAAKKSMFKGEFVFLRSDVDRARSSKAWLYEGRKVRDGEVPVKVVKKRQMPKRGGGGKGGSFGEVRRGG